MLTNGFYTKLHDWMFWVTYLSVPRYTFTALLKLEFHWTDTFQVPPMHGSAAFGYPTMYIPAETTPVFASMLEKKVNIMDSPHDPSIVSETLTLSAAVLVFTVGAWLILLRQARAINQEPQLHEHLDDDIQAARKQNPALAGFSKQDEQIQRMLSNKPVLLGASQTAHGTDEKGQLQHTTVSKVAL
jgi:hypothetical protein